MGGLSTLQVLFKDNISKEATQALKVEKSKWLWILTLYIH